MYPLLEFQQLLRLFRHWDGLDHRQTSLKRTSRRGLNEYFADVSATCVSSREYVSMMALSDRDVSSL